MNTPVSYLPNHLYTFTHARITLTRKQLKETLLVTDGKVIVAGRLRRIKSKHIGAGVYDVWLEEDDA